MYILLTDILTCPRCGPDYGLILLADHIADRRVLAGTLGCPNCRERYAIIEGFGELGAGWSDTTSPDAPDAAVRLAALLGVTEGPAFVLLVGASARHAEAVADLVPGIEVIAASDDARAWPERAGVSRIGVGETLPLLDRKLRAIALDGAESIGLIGEAVRLLGPGGRLVVSHAPADAAARIGAAGLTILAEQDGTVVAERR
jgi:uncharacterized protein YbaR (Trm112 family)